MAWDLAFMFPMLEMSSYKSHYVKDMLYAYNLVNPLNDHKVDNTYQVKLEKEIRSKEKYKPLQDYKKASDFLRFNRFDIAAKTIYAKSILNNSQSDFAKRFISSSFRSLEWFCRKTSSQRWTERLFRIL